MTAETSSLRLSTSKAISCFKRHPNGSLLDTEEHVLLHSLSGNQNNRSSPRTLKRHPGNRQIHNSLEQTCQYL